MQVVVVLVREAASAVLIVDLIPPRVFAALALRQLHHALTILPHQPLPGIYQCIWRLAGIVGPNAQVMGHAGQVSTLRRRQLLEVADEDDVHAAEGPGLTSAVR